MNAMIYAAWCEMNTKPIHVSWCKVSGYGKRWNLDGYGYIEAISGVYGFKWVFGHRWLEKPEHGEFDFNNSLYPKLLAIEKIEAKFATLANEQGFEFTINRDNFDSVKY